MRFSFADMILSRWKSDCTSSRRTSDPAFQESGCTSSSTCSQRQVVSLEYGRKGEPDPGYLSSPSVVFDEKPKPLIDGALGTIGIGGPSSSLLSEESRRTKIVAAEGEVISKSPQGYQDAPVQSQTMYMKCGKPFTPCFPRYPRPFLTNSKSKKKPRPIGGSCSHSAIVTNGPVRERAKPYLSPMPPLTPLTDQDFEIESVPQQPIIRTPAISLPSPPKINKIVEVEQGAIHAEQLLGTRSLNASRGRRRRTKTRQDIIPVRDIVRKILKGKKKE